MRQKAQIRPSNHRRVTFESIFEQTLPNINYIWHPVDKTIPIDTQLTVFSGKLLNKNSETDRWESYLFEVQPDRCFKIPINTNSDFSEFCYLHGCFLKKFNHYDSQYPTYKYGFRLQAGANLSFFVTDSPEQFKRWFMVLRRFCILEKFSRKYKIVAQLKYNDPIFGQNCFYNCIRLSDAAYFLLKIIPKDHETLNHSKIQGLFKEIQNLRRLNHPQLARLLEIYEDENNIYLIFDNFMGGDLRQHLRESQLLGDMVGSAIDEKLLAELMFGLIQAVFHTHSRGVFHRDIKLDNLFVPESKRIPFVLISNFCYSESFILTPQTNQSQGYKKCGTPGYVAPEIFKTKHYDQKIDIFSLGVVFYILIYGRMPFEGKDQDELLRNNEKCEIDFKAEKRLCKKVSQSGIDLLKSMLIKDPQKRYSSSQALNHHWFIKTKVRDEQKQKQMNNLGRVRSLSTIVENSEYVEMTNRSNFSFLKNQGQASKNDQLAVQPRTLLQPNIMRQSKSNSKQNTQEIINIPDIIDREFQYEFQINQKMVWFNQQHFQKVPSIRRHRQFKNLQLNQVENTKIN